MVGYECISRGIAGTSGGIFEAILACGAPRHASHVVPVAPVAGRALPSALACNKVLEQEPAVQHTRKSTSILVIVQCIVSLVIVACSHTAHPHRRGIKSNRGRWAAIRTGSGHIIGITVLTYSLAGEVLGIGVIGATGHAHLGDGGSIAYYTVLDTCGTLGEPGVGADCDTVLGGGIGVGVRRARANTRGSGIVCEFGGTVCWRHAVSAVIGVQTEWASSDAPVVVLEQIRAT